MRKLYTLVAGLLIVLFTTKTNAQLNFQDLNSQTSNNVAAVAVSNEITETCQVDFEITAEASSPRIKKFTAIPSHSEQKPPVYICWKFGDGKDTCIQYSNINPGSYSVIHYYQQPGSYEACVKIVYEGGCEAIKCKAVYVTIPDECRADFERFAMEPTLNPLYVTFKALPWHNNNKKPKRICWYFGDGKDTCIEYSNSYTAAYLVRHKYREPGTYQVCVKILYDSGCEAGKCKSVSIRRPDSCVADLERIPVPGTNDQLTLGFRAIIPDSSNKVPQVICWSFGDGKDTCIEYAQNFSGPYTVRHRYSVPGIYTVCIKITYYNGCEAVKCKSIVITNPDECHADFEKLLITSSNPLTVAYKALPWHNNNKKPKTICWRFGDGKDTCISYPENYTGSYTVVHEYSHSGQYEVCVKILYYGGCEAYKCKLIQVGALVQCKVDFEKIPISTTNNPLNVAFKALPWHIENKKPKLICWKFGDGKDTCIQYEEDFAGPYVVHHRYDRSGNYEVCVKIIYFGGCESKKCEVIKVEGQGECRVKLFELTPSISSLVRGFFVSPWSSDKRPVSVCWYFGDGTDTCIQINSGIFLSQLFIRHTYPAPGVYRTCVKVLFEGGCIAVDCTEVVIRPVTHACGGYMTDSLISPRTFKFKAFPIHDPDDPVVGYRWTFGDGSVAAGREVTHQYNVPGTYEVCLIIKTQRGCETKICKPLRVPGNTQISLQITPNPVINVMHVLFYSTHNEQAAIRVVNSYGVTVRNWIRNATQGGNNWDFDVSTLPAGAYTLYVQSPNQLASQLIIKTN